MASNTAARARPDLLARWLLVVALLVWAMVIVGGITRLTESGLSITEWKPVTGALPPLSEAAWLVEYEKYLRVPQASTIHAGITLAQFKVIFFWEWVHRLLGRVIGLAFALPLAWFWVRRQIPVGYKVRLLALLALGGLQGAVGWWMVTSGLWQGERVSHLRLAVHLLLALFILAGLVWTALDLRALGKDGRARPARFMPVSIAVSAILLVQLLYGAWVAGMRAGQVAPDWPTMQGKLYPDGVDWSQGAGHALVHDPFLTHFIHRWWAWVLVVALILFARRVKRTGGRRASVAIHATFGTQIILGILTVLSGVVIWLGVLHQAVGALVVASVAWGAHILGRAGR